MSATQETERDAFVWKDHGRFVEVRPVNTGWLVVWGHYEDLGTVRVTQGNTVYRSLHGARRRLVDAALEITRSPQAAADATRLFDLFEFPEHAGELPDTL